MPIYMSIFGVSGPVTYQGISGYFDIQSIRFFRGYNDDQNRTVLPSFAFTRPSDSFTPRLLALLQEPARSTPRDAVVYYVGGESGKPLQELLQVWLTGVTMLSYQASGDVDTFVFQNINDAANVPHTAMQTTNFTRPQDQGRIAAAKALSVPRLA